MPIFLTFVASMLTPKTNNNQSVIKSPLLKWTMKYCFLLVLSFSFFTQHLLALSLYEREHYTDNTPPHFVSTLHQLGFYVKGELPPQTSFTAIEMELEEDELLSEVDHDLYFNSISHHSFLVSSFEALLATRYRQISSSFMRQPVSPLFVLYHAWKDSIA